MFVGEIEMTNRVIHQEYLEAWLRGESIQRCYKGGDWFDFTIKYLSLDVFNINEYEFRITPKTVEVNLTDFYADYYSINYTTDTVEFGIALTDLFNKYLLRGGL